jgi:hypothetical protein
MAGRLSTIVDKPYLIKTLTDKGRSPSEFGLKVMQLVDDLFGIHHLTDSLDSILAADWGSDRWIELTLFNVPLCTYDNDGLTMLVVGAHHQCIRIELHGEGDHAVKLCFSPRQREGKFYERHRTMTEAIAAYEQRYG